MWEKQSLNCQDTSCKGDSLQLSICQPASWCQMDWVGWISDANTMRLQKAWSASFFSAEHASSAGSFEDRDLGEVAGGSSSWNLTSNLSQASLVKKAVTWSLKQVHYTIHLACQWVSFDIELFTNAFQSFCASFDPSWLSVDVFAASP